MLNYKEDDLSAWKTYKKMPTPDNRSTLLHRFDGIIRTNVNKWAGNVPQDVLLTQAKVLVAKSFDTYDPSRGTALATHVTNALLPLSRTVYTYQNTARLPENMALKMNTYNQAVSQLTDLNGYTPSTEEISDHLGWTKKEVERINKYNRKSLLESGSAVSGSFYETNLREDEDTQLLSGVYMELSPDDRKLFEMITGYKRLRPLSNLEIMKETGMSQAQLSYKKRLITDKLNNVIRNSAYRRRYGG